MLGNKRKCRRDVFDDLVADKIVEIDPNPSGLQPFPALVDYLFWSIPSNRCPYGPAQEQPPRAWMPKRSL